MLLYNTLMNAVRDLDHTRFSPCEIDSLRKLAELLREANVHDTRELATILTHR